MVSLNSINNKYRSIPGEFPLSNNQDQTQIVTAVTRCCGGDGGVDGGDDDDDDGDDVQLDDDVDGVDFPSPGGNFPGGFLPAGELFSLWCLSAAQRRLCLFSVTPRVLGFRDEEVREGEAARGGCGPPPHKAARPSLGPHRPMGGGPWWPLSAPPFGSLHHLEK